MGVRANDDSWFAVFGEHLDQLLIGAGADRSIALAEADRRNWLHRTASDRKNRSLATKIAGVGPRMIRFDLPPADDDHQDHAEPEPELPPGCPECDTTLPLHSPHCSQFTPDLWTDDDHQGQDTAVVTETVTTQAQPEPGPFSPFTAEVRGYLATHAGRATHPTAEGAVRSIPHRGNLEAAMIRAAFTDMTGMTPTEPVAAPEQPDLITPDIEPTPGPAEPTTPPVAAPTADGADPADDDREAWGRAVRKMTDDASEEDIEAARQIFHQVTGGIRWVSYSGQVGQAWFASLAARYPSMKAPAPLASPKVAEITEAGPLTRINYTVKPTANVKTAGKFVTSYDLNGQHMAAAGSADLGDGEPKVIEHPRDITGLTGHPGYVLTSAPVKTGHPAFGTIEPGTWLAMPLARFLVRDLGLTVPAAEVVYWPDHGRRMSVYVARYRDARERLMKAEPTEATRLTLAMLKSQANAFVGMFHSKTYSHGGFYRPDWYDMIVATAEANALRAMGKCSVAPVAKMADSAYWIADTAPYVPDGITISGQLGKWKLDRHGPVTDEFLTALRDLAPASARDAVIKINTDRLAGE